MKGTASRALTIKNYVFNDLLKTPCNEQKCYSERSENSNTGKLRSFILFKMTKKPFVQRLSKRSVKVS